MMLYTLIRLKRKLIDFIFGNHKLFHGLLYHSYMCERKKNHKTGCRYINEKGHLILSVKCLMITLQLQIVETLHFAMLRAILFECENRYIPKKIRKLCDEPRAMQRYFCCVLSAWIVSSFEAIVFERHAFAIYSDRFTLHTLHSRSFLCRSKFDCNAQNEESHQKRKKHTHTHSQQQPKSFFFSCAIS